MSESKQSASPSIAEDLMRSRMAQSVGKVIRDLPLPADTLASAGHPRAAVSRPRRLRGFTTVELVITIVLIGILAAVAMPRMNLIGGFDEVGFRDQVVAALEFARKTAVAQRRCVQVSLSGSTLSFRIANDVPEGANATNFSGALGRDLILPGSNGGQISPRASGTTITDGPPNLVFHPLGKTSDSSSVTYTIHGESDHVITVDYGTGYVSY